MRIWKWQIELKDRQTLDIPKGAKLLDVQVQFDAVCLWALCDEKAEKEARKIAVYGTGNPMPNDAGDYVATFQVGGGNLVFHLFDLGA